MGYPSVTVPLICIQLCAIGLVADSTTADQYKMPFPADVVAVEAGATRQYGTTPHTDVDVTVKKGATDLLTARIPAVDASTIAAGGLSGTLVSTAASLALAVGDVLKLDVDITGGSSPVIDVWANVWVARKPS